LIQLATQNPEATVLTGYALAGLILYFGVFTFLDDLPIPLIGNLNLAGYIVIAVSFFYHYQIIGPETHIESLFMQITSIAGFTVLTTVVGKELYKSLT
jgi:hypothetical protein